MNLLWLFQSSLLYSSSIRTSCHPAYASSCYWSFLSICFRKSRAISLHSKLPKLCQLHWGTAEVCGRWQLQVRNNKIKDGSTWPPLCKIDWEWTQAFETFGSFWWTSVTYDWSMVSKGNCYPIIAFIVHANEPRNLCVNWLQPPSS